MHKLYLFLSKSTNLKTKSKIVIFTGTCLFIAILITSIIFYSVYSSVMINKSIEMTKEQLAVAVSNINNELDSYARLLYTLRLDKSLHDQIVKDDSDIYNEYFDTYYGYFIIIRKINDYLNSLRVSCMYPPELELYLLPQKDHPTSYNPIYFDLVKDIDSVSDLPWFKKLMESNRANILWESVTQEDSNDKDNISDVSKTSVFSASIVLRNRKTGQDIAVARIIQSTKQFTNTVKKTLDLNNGSFFILDNQHRIVHSVNTNFESLPKDFIQWNTETYSYPLNGYANITINSKKKTAYLQHDDIMNWQYFYITNNSIILEQIFAWQRLLLLLLISVITLAILLLLPASNIVTHRLVKLTKAVEKIDEENLFLEPQFFGEDEIGILASKFANVLKMVRKLIEKNLEAEREKSFLGV